MHHFTQKKKNVHPDKISLQNLNLLIIVNITWMSFINSPVNGEPKWA